jgi:alkylhydroperoxidase family enzyme
VSQPARLVPADLDPLRALVGAGALDYAVVVGAFHFINRIADLLHVDPEALPAPLRRVEPLRRLTVRVASRLMARMDLRERAYPVEYDAAVAEAAPVFAHALGGPVGDALAPLRARPKIVEALRLALEERDQRSSLDRATLARVHRTVETALPADDDEARGFHARPADPVEAFAFVGTRYAHRTTDGMIAALRRAGLDDVGILDLATAVADANQWARLHRLVGLRAELFSLASPR